MSAPPDPDDFPSPALGSEMPFRELLRATPDAMLVADLDGLIVLANDRVVDVFGYRPEELLGQPIEVLVPARLRGGHAAHRQRYQGTPTPRPMGSELALSGVRRDGSEFPVEISLSPLHTTQRTLVLAAVRDVTEKRRVEGALRQAMREAEAANQELESFSYSVAHDLRSPLRSIDGFSLALLEDYGDKLDDEGRAMLARVRAAAGRMAQLIDDLLGLSRVTRAELRRERVDLSALAEEVVARLRGTEPERRVDVQIEPGLEVLGDAALLRIALENLLANAWKFSAKRPVAHLVVGARAESAERAYFVRDDGAGFDMTYANKLFGAFQRLHKQSEFDGTGVGLATVSRIVRRHGGRVWAEGQVDQGATFYFTLPGGTLDG
jgi:PAS domain S-box-containing protein